MTTAMKWIISFFMTFVGLGFIITFLVVLHKYSLLGMAFAIVVGCLLYGIIWAVVHVAVFERNDWDL